MQFCLLTEKKTFDTIDLEICRTAVLSDVRMYASDNNLTHGPPKPWRAVLILSLNHDLGNLKVWLHSNGLNPNVLKTKCLCLQEQDKIPLHAP